MTYLGKDDVLCFSNKIMTFIEANKLENEYGNLIIDYIEKLFLNDFPVLESDIEQEVYLFYNYLTLYSYILIVDGEDSFINTIVEERKNLNWG